MGDSKNKSPAFQFYPKDWLSDVRVRSMTPAQRGYYIDLLAYMWLEPEAQLPNDDELLAGLLHCSADDLRVVKGCLAIGSKVVTQKRLQAERDKQREWREKSKLGGLKSAAKRRKASAGNDKEQPNGGATTLGTTLATKGQPKGNIASSFSFSKKANRGVDNVDNFASGKAAFKKLPDWPQPDQKVLSQLAKYCMEQDPTYYEGQTGAMRQVLKWANQYGMPKINAAIQANNIHGSPGLFTFKQLLEDGNV